MSITVPEYVLSVDRSQLAEFFLSFARFEFSLKASGFACKGQWGAEVDWIKFSREIGPSLLRSTSRGLQQSITYLRSSPPKQQVFANHTLCWQPRTPPANWSEMQKLLFYVRGTRNNLVHGAKFIARENTDPDRDEKLLEAASCVLAECLRLCPKASRAFNGDAP